MEDMYGIILAHQEEAFFLSTRPNYDEWIYSNCVWWVLTPARSFLWFIFLGQATPSRCISC